MKKIVTVTGEIQQGELGFCQCHEHILLSKGQSFLINPVLFFDEPEKSIAEVKSYKLAGGCSFVDAQPLGCNRMAEGLVRVSEETGVNIIASTGFHKLLFYPENHWIFRASREMLGTLWTTELVDGMYADGDRDEPKRRIRARAGQIKTAFDVEGLSERYRTLFLAAADTAKATGAPLMVHIENGTDPRELLSFLLEEGVPAKQIIFCHMDRACQELAWHEEVAAAGAYLEYDTIGRFKYHSDGREIDIIRHMLNAGFAGQLLMSLDTTRARLGNYGGSITLNYLIDEFLPQMKDAGIPEETVRQIMITNSAEAFSWK